jgi:hypothetical protein
MPVVVTTDGFLSAFAAPPSAFAQPDKKVAARMVIEMNDTPASID